MMNSKIMMNTKNNKFTFEFKIQLIQRIEKITDKKHIETIKQLILNDNQDLIYTQHRKGFLLFFHNLTETTYEKLDLYLSRILIL